MKIRIFSDLHLDVNKINGYPVKLPKNYDKNIFTLICGDIDGDVINIKKWISRNVKRGLFIAGNHIVYSDNLNYFTIEKRKQYLSDNFPINKDVSFLDYNHVMSKQIPNTNILVIGSTLYTDYRYNNFIQSSLITPSEILYTNKILSESYLNDFNYGFTYDDLNSFRKITATDYEKWHKETLNKIKEIVENNTDKDIIIMTHHCPSEKCISRKFITSNLNASYCSSLDDFIIQHKNIKAWVSGHVHHIDSFKIGQCLVILNPLGYLFADEGKNFSFNTFLDTDTWSVIVE